MGARGPKPKPKALKILDGTRADRINDTEPIAPEGVPTPPDHLDEIAVKEWERIAPILHKMKVLTIADGAALAIYCMTYSEWVQAQAKIKKQGMAIATGLGGLKINPHLTVAIQARATLIKILSEFGCTPSSRSRVTVADDKPTDALAELIASRKAK